VSFWFSIEGLELDCIDPCGCNRINKGMSLPQASIMALSDFRNDKSVLIVGLKLGR